MYININITFMCILRFILASKLTPFTFFIWIFTNIITFLHGRFVYIHTFFHHQITCSCRLGICLCDISRADYERRLHRIHVAPSVPIWATFAPTLGKICPWSNQSSTPVLSRDVPPRLYIGTYYWGKFVLPNPHTRTWENPDRFFFAHPVIICTVYCWEKCKKM